MADRDSQPLDTPCLIGVDGGASKVRAALFRRHEDGSLTPTGPTQTLPYPKAGGFQPVPLAAQLDAWRTGRVEPTPEEEEHGALVLDAVAAAIRAVVPHPAPPRRTLGIAFPGTKTTDGLGIVVLRNGPRMPRFASALEERLSARGVAVDPPITALHSDGVAAGWGEELRHGGPLRDVDSALVLGCGTGIAEALKLRGRHLHGASWPAAFEAAWSLTDANGVPFEERASMRAMRACFERAHDGDATFDDAAREGDAAAHEALRDGARALAELLFRRLGDLANELDAHLDRIVLTQHTARLWRAPELVASYRTPLESELATRLGEVGWGAPYLAGGTLRPGLLVASESELAPAIGALGAELGLVLTDHAHPTTP